MNKTKNGIPYEHKIPISLEGYDKDLLQELKGIDFIVAGGAVVTSVQHSIGKLASKSADIDLFFISEDEFTKARNIMMNKTTFLYDSKYSESFQHQNQKYQLIKPKLGNHDNFKELLDDFDLNNSKWFSIYPFDYGYSREGLETLHHISIGKTNPKRYDEHITYTDLFRILKYINTKKLDWPRSSRDQVLISNLIIYNKDEYHNKNNMDYKVNAHNNQMTEEEYKIEDRNNSIFGALKSLQDNRTPSAHDILSYIIYKEDNGTLPDLEVFAKMQSQNGANIDNTGIKTLNYFIIKDYLDQDHDGQLIYGIGYKLENPEYQEKVSEFMKLKYPEVVL